MGQEFPYELIEHERYLFRISENHISNPDYSQKISIRWFEPGLQQKNGEKDILFFLHFFPLLIFTNGCVSFIILRASGNSIMRNEPAVLTAERKVIIFIRFQNFLIPHSPEFATSRTNSFLLLLLPAIIPFQIIIGGLASGLLHLTA